MYFLTLVGVMNFVKGMLDHEPSFGSMTREDIMAHEEFIIVSCCVAADGVHNYVYLVNPWTQCYYTRTIVVVLPRATIML